MKAKKRIYLDNASTTPVMPGVFAAMLPYLTKIYGNPSSLHEEGRLAKRAIEGARMAISRVIGSVAEEIIFTSGGTESDNLAILGLARANKNKGNHIIVSSIEHKVVLDACLKLIKEGFEVTYLDVNKSGVISLDHLKSSLRADTILVSIMYANNEIGTIQPINEISKLLKSSTICQPIFHTDACQAAGALAINVKKLGIDAMTISASKIHGPKGIGCLYLNKNYLVEPIIVGGGQENGLRSGTENVASIVGLAEALNIADSNKENESVRLTQLRNYFITKVLKKIKGVSLNGSLRSRLPNNINISITRVEGESLVLLLDEEGIACSTGSACDSESLKPSHVLTSIGLSDESAHCSIRFTLGEETKKSDLNYVINKLSKSVDFIRKMSAIKS